jgi:hypothetical protein
LALGAFANIKGSLSFKDVNSGIPTAHVGYQGNLYYINQDGSFEIQTVDPASIKFNANSAHKVLTGAYDVFGRKLNQAQTWAGQLTSIKQYTEVQGVGARSLTSPDDTLYIVVNGDTLREVPITSWNQILPPNYIQQRNVQVNVKSAFYLNTAQVVWWNNDSIAHVLNLQKNSTVSGSFSGYIYTVYNDSDFAKNAHLYNLFVRTRSNDSITSYTGILDVKAQVGNLVFPDSAFKVNTYHTTLGYSLTPNDSSVASFAKKNISMVFQIDSLDSTLNISSDYPNKDTIQFPAIGGTQYVSGDTTITIKLDSCMLSGIVTEMNTFSLNVVNSVGGNIPKGNIASVPDTFKVDIGVFGANSKVWIQANKTTNLKAELKYTITKSYWKNP